jgi:hypothetical protein
VLSASNYAACLLTIMVALFKLVRGGRGEGRVPVRCLCGFFVSLGLGLAIMAPSSLNWVSRFEPTPNLGRLAGNSCEMTGAYFLALLAFTVSSPESARRRGRQLVGVLLVAVAAMTVLLITGDTTFTVNFVNIYSHSPVIVGYEAVFFAFVCTCLVIFTRMVRRYARHAGSPSLRTGLALVIAGSVGGVAWAGWSGVRPVIALVSGRELATTAPVGFILGALCLFLWLGGSTLTAWAKGMLNPVVTVRAWRRYHGMRPIWVVLRAAVPDVVLGARPSRWLPMPLQDVEFALYRRVIEIHDARLALRPHTPPEIADQARETAQRAGVAGGPALAATVEAATIAAAIIARAADRRYAVTGPSIPDSGVPDVTSEALWLSRVSRAYRRSRVVREIREGYRAALSPELVVTDGSSEPTR